MTEEKSYQQRESSRGLGSAGGAGIKTDKDGERMCEEVCASERVSERVSVCA